MLTPTNNDPAYLLFRSYLLFGYVAFDDPRRKAKLAACNALYNAACRLAGLQVARRSGVFDLL